MPLPRLFDVIVLRLRQRRNVNILWGIFKMARIRQTCGGQLTAVSGPRIETAADETSFDVSPDPLTTLRCHDPPGVSKYWIQELPWGDADVDRCPLRHDRAPANQQNP